MQASLTRALITHDIYAMLQAMSAALMLVRWVLLVASVPRLAPVLHAVVAVGGALLACLVAAAAVCVPLAVLILLLAGDKAAEQRSTLRSVLALPWEVAAAGACMADTSALRQF